MDLVKKRTPMGIRIKEGFIMVKKMEGDNMQKMEKEKNMIDIMMNYYLKGNI